MSDARTERKKTRKGSWLVRVRCTVLKELVCEDCTEEQASSLPWDHSVEEIELDQMDWQVEGVKPND